MKNIFKSLSLGNLLNLFRQVFFRFPVSILVIVIATVIFMILANWHFSWVVEDNLVRFALSLIISFFLSVWVYIFWESYDLDFKKINLLQILVILFWIAFYFWLDADLFQSDEWVVFFILTLAWIISFLFFSPFIIKILKKDLDCDLYYRYFYKISIVFFMSFILWFSLFLLWIIWINSVDYLFDLRINIWEYIWYWASISLVFITPIFALNQLPKKDQIFLDKDFIENKFFSFLVKYIALPFILIYFLILYAYSIKVLLNFWDWPKWQVSWMVIWFSSFWYLVYIFSYYFDKTNNFIKKFRLIFPYVVIPQTFMLFYAIYLRINQYDLTMNRYFVVVFWLWLVLISFYYVFSNKKYLMFIPLSLTIITILISIWPWWVYSLPESRQLSKLEDNLQKAWIIKGWEIIPLKSYKDIDAKLSNDIYSWIDYLCGFNNCRSIKSLFKDKYDDMYKEAEETFNQSKKTIYTDKFGWLSNWQIVSWITEYIKVKRDYSYNYSNRSKYTSVRIQWVLFPIDVKWYDSVLSIYSDLALTSVRDKYIYMDIGSKTMYLKDFDSKNLDSVSVDSIFESLSNKYIEYWSDTFEKEDLIYELSSDNYDYKIFFQNTYIDNPDYDWWDNYSDYFYANWYVLIRKK